jgi:hypothetical protein
MNKHQLHCSITAEMTCKNCSLYMSTQSYQKILIARELQAINNFFKDQLKSHTQCLFLAFIAQTFMKEITCFQIL